MTMALPEYIESPVREIMLEEYPGGLKQLAAKAKLPYTTVVGLFKTNKHVSLSAWIALAGDLGLDPDDMCVIFKAKDMKLSLLALAGCPSIIELTKDLKHTQRTYVYSLVRGIAGARIKSIYLPLCKALGLTLSELFEYLDSVVE